MVKGSTEVNTQIRRIPAALLTALAVLFSAVLVAPPAHAETLVSTQQSAAKAADWIKKQYDNGAYKAGDDAGVFAEGIMALSSARLHRATVDAMLGDLQAAGPAWVKSGSNGGADRLAKILLTADIAGHEDPARFFGKDRDLAAELIALVKARQLPQHWAGYMSTIALPRPGGRGGLPGAARTSLRARWVVAAGGGFGYGTSPAKGDPDYTGVGISAMLLLSRDTTVSKDVRDEAAARLKKAIGWTADDANRRTDGKGDYYWISRFAGTDLSSANSTGVVASALAEAGVNVESPLRALKREQAATLSGAAWSNTNMGKRDDVRATAQAIFAMTGAGYATATFPRPKKLAAATPKISGTAQVGKKLTAKRGTWTSGTSFAYQWLRDGKKISKATKSTYTLVAKDKGKKITVTVTGKKSGYTTVAKTSAKTSKVKAGKLTSKTPTIKGTAKVGKKLTAKAGSWKPTGVKLTYQWYRNGKKIAKATKSAYTLKAADKGTKITVKVKGTKSGYTSATLTSQATAKVK